VIFIDIPAERTTALTDVILVMAALYGLMSVRRIGKEDPAKARIWSWIFGLMAFAAGLGAALHGLTMPPVLKERLWVPLYLLLGMTVSLFPAAAVYDLRGPGAVRRAMYAMTFLLAAFWVSAVSFSGGFTLFLLYSAAVLVFMAGAYGWMAVKTKAAGAWLMAAGFVVSLMAGAVQATKGIRITLVWTFDHNGLYHILLTAGLIAIIAGLRKGRQA
jgi:hypothetical protein